MSICELADRFTEVFDVFPSGNVDFLDVLAKSLCCSDGEEAEDLGLLREAIDEDVSLDQAKVVYREGTHDIASVDR